MNYNDYHKKAPASRRTKVWFFILGMLCCFLFIYSGKKVLNYTSTDKYCISCHVHPDADQSWKLSAHYNNSSGNVVHCTECHMPPQGPVSYTHLRAHETVLDLVC